MAGGQGGTKAGAAGEGRGGLRGRRSKISVARGTTPGASNHSPSGSKISCSALPLSPKISVGRLFLEESAATPIRVSRSIILFIPLLCGKY